LLSAKSSPVEDFLKDYKFSNHWSLFRDYSVFLLNESGALELPVPLRRIREKIELARHITPLDQRGFLLSNNIFINSDDARSIQRFTEAHEIMELLTSTLESAKKYQIRNPDKKEKLCEYGASELLMPTILVKPIISEIGLSLSGGTELANLCQTSLTAAIRKILSLDLSPQIFAILRENYKKSQFVPSSIGQGVLWGQPEDWDPDAELRVWRCWSSPQTKLYLCQNESFGRNTLAYSLLKHGTPGFIESKQDILDLEYIKGEYLVEGMRVNIDGSPCVMLLMHL
jgi:hypothetical protein